MQNMHLFADSWKKNTCSQKAKGQFIQPDAVGQMPRQPLALLPSPTQVPQVPRDRHASQRQKRLRSLGRVAVGFLDVGPSSSGPLDNFSVPAGTQGREQRLTNPHETRQHHRQKIGHRGFCLGGCSIAAFPNCREIALLFGSQLLGIEVSFRPFKNRVAPRCRYMTPCWGHEDLHADFWTGATGHIFPRRTQGQATSGDNPGDHPNRRVPKTSLRSSQTASPPHIWQLNLGPPKKK